MLYLMVLRIIICFSFVLGLTTHAETIQELQKRLLVGATHIYNQNRSQENFLKMFAQHFTQKDRQWVIEVFKTHKLKNLPPLIMQGSMVVVRENPKWKLGLNQLNQLKFTQNDVHFKFKVGRSFQYQVALVEKLQNNQSAKLKKMRSRKRKSKKSKTLKNKNNKLEDTTAQKKTVIGEQTEIMQLTSAMALSAVIELLANPVAERVNQQLQYIKLQDQKNLFRWDLDEPALHLSCGEKGQQSLIVAVNGQRHLFNTQVSWHKNLTKTPESTIWQISTKNDLDLAIDHFFHLTTDWKQDEYGFLSGQVWDQMVTYKYANLKLADICSKDTNKGFAKCQNYCLLSVLSHYTKKEIIPSYVNEKGDEVAEHAVDVGRNASDIDYAYKFCKKNKNCFKRYEKCSKVEKKPTHKYQSYMGKLNMSWNPISGARQIKPLEKIKSFYPREHKTERILSFKKIRLGRYLAALNRYSTACCGQKDHSYCERRINQLAPMSASEIKRTIQLGNK